MEAIVADQRRVDEILDACTAYWKSTGVTAATAEDMRREIEPHLRQAVAEGKDPSVVVGDDVAAFAETWAAEWRDPARRWHTIPNQPPRKSRGLGPLLALGAGIAALLALLAIFGPKEDAMDDIETFRWIWLGIALLLGIGEMLSAGLFMLPFAIGAAAAGLLSFFGISVWAQVGVFLLVSILAMLGLRRYSHSDREPSLPVGSLHYRDAIGLVTEDIDPVSGAGRVRLESEMWRASTDVGGIIPAGTEVVVHEVRGTRLIVSPRRPGEGHHEP